MWLPKLFPVTRRRSQVQVRRRSTSRLCLESLEDRCVPTATLASALSIGSTGSDGASGVVTDNTGNVYMTGQFSGSVDFDPANVHTGNADILTAGGAEDIYVAKYDPTGALVWARQMPGVAGTFGVGKNLTLDATGNIYLGGYFGGQVAFGSTNLVSVTTRDGFVTKLDSNGNAQWVTSWTDATKTYVQAVAVDSAGNVLAVEEADTRGIIRKFDATGAPLWMDQIACGTAAGATSVAADSAGNAYVCGSFTGNVDFNPGSGTYTVSGGAAFENGYVLKLTPAGAFSWVSPFIGQTSHSVTGTSRCNDLALDQTGNIVVGGWYTGQVDFKPGAGTYTLPNSVSSPGFVTKLSTTGALVWASQVEHDVTSLTLDASGSVYVTGYFSVPSQVFVAKVTSSGNLRWAVSFGGTVNAFANGIAVDGNGNVYVVGGYYYDNGGSVNFNPDPFGTPDYLTSAGLGDIFLVKLKQN
jgi:Beta-propeller repeat